MTKLASSEPPTGRQTPQQGALSSIDRVARLRLRAAWMYYIEEMTQNEIAQCLGIGRVTVTRLLSDARQRNEVRFQVGGGVPECIALERELEVAFGLREAVVAPLSDARADATLVVSAATGQFMAEFLKPSMRLGVGWGRTLLESLQYIPELSVSNLSIVSLLGGITKVKRFNPSEFAWRFSDLLQAECYLMTAPAILDSARTKQTLIEKCGLREVFERTKTLDAILVSVGELRPDATAYRDGFVADQLRREMIDAGAVGEVLFHYYRANGKLVEHPLRDCVMNPDLDILRSVPQRIIASGGIHKAAALRGAIKLLRPTVLITDEDAARELLLAESGEHGDGASRA